MKFPLRRTLPALLFLLVVLPAFSQEFDMASLEKRVTVKKLDNGLTIVVMQRPEAPVFSFFTIVDAGSSQDPLGETGLAHMFEHMAFKGTDTIGTRDYAGEKVALAKVEEAYAAYIAERDQPVGRDEARLKQLEKDIPAIRFSEVLVDEVHGPNSYDVMLHIRLDDARAFRQDYMPHPKHVPVQRYIEARVSGIADVDVVRK